MNLTLTNGFVSDYDDYYLWVESFEESANACMIAKDEDGEAITATASKVVKIVDHASYDSEDDYSDAVDEVMNEDFDTSAEFMTPDGIYFVAVEFVDDGQDLEDFEIGADVEYC